MLQVSVNVQNKSQDQPRPKDVRNDNIMKKEKNMYDQICNLFQFKDHNEVGRFCQPQLSLRYRQI